MFTALFSKKHIWIASLIIAGVVFLNLRVGRLLDYSLTIAPVACLFFLMHFNVKKNGSKFFVPWALVILYVLVKSALDSAYSKSESELLKTFSLWLFYWTIIWACIAFPVKRELSLNQLSNTCLSLFYLISLVCAVQVLIYKTMGNFNILSIWGEHLYAGQEYVVKSVEFGALKSTGFYFEPAYCALVLFALCAAAQTVSEIKIRTYAIMAGAFFIIGSSSGIISLLTLIVIANYAKITDPKKSNIIYASLLILTMAISGIIFYEALFERISHINIESSSTYYRLVAPARIVLDVLFQTPLGAPLGAMESDVQRYMLANGETIGKTIDNGWYLLIYYFGWPGIFASLTIILLGLKYSIKHKNGSLEAFSFFILSPFFTGAVFSPEFLLLQLIVLFSFKQRVLQWAKVRS